MIRIANSLSEVREFLVEMMEGSISSFSFEGTNFNMDEDDGSINLENGTKKKKLLPDGESTYILDQVEEVIKKYEEFK